MEDVHSIDSLVLIIMSQLLVLEIVVVVAEATVLAEKII